uniref:Ig-like domain-containing protein n=1 Tax=Equus asinus TaxID=9793 RepID=A0A8C4LI55_EQUAS
MLPLLLPLLWAGSLGHYDRSLLEVPESVTVQEGLCVTVPCSFSRLRRYWIHGTPTHGSWFRKGANPHQDAAVATNDPDRKVQEETQGRFHLLGSPQWYTCSLDITDAQKKDEGMYFFRADRVFHRPYDYRENQLSVHVTDLAETPDIHTQGTLESGQPNNITCTAPWACERGTPPTFSWIGVALTSLGPKTPNTSVLTLTLGPQDHGSNLTCRVTLPGAGVSAERTIQLNVSCECQARMAGFLRAVALGNGSSLPVKEGQSLRLVCVADSNPPAMLSWTRGSLPLSPSAPSNPGVLELPRVVLEDGGEFTCQAQHPGASYHSSVNLVVQGISCSCPHISGEQRGTWPLVLTLLRGALMGAGFLLTYGLTWIYYTRIAWAQGPQDHRAAWGQNPGAGRY